LRSHRFHHPGHICSFQHVSHQNQKRYHHSHCLFASLGISRSIDRSHVPVTRHDSDVPSFDCRSLFLSRHSDHSSVISWLFALSAGHREIACGSLCRRCRRQFNLENSFFCMRCFSKEERKPSKLAHKQYKKS
jgi:hypothetical protein